MNTDTPPDLFTRQADYFKALSHPVRLQILIILRQGEACVCHLEAILHKRQAYISQQLAVLKEARLLSERKDGLFVFYRLADPHITTVLDSSLLSIERQKPLPMRRDWEAVTSSDGCVCPICTTKA